MSDPKHIIETYQKRQQRAPFLLGGLAVVLVIAGLLILALWLTDPERSGFTLFASDTPTPTATYTNTPVPPTQTSVPPTETPTPTDTPTITPTPTIEGPFYYTVQEGDTLTTIAEKFGVSVLRIMEVNEMENPDIFVGVPILIPDPNEVAPTATPIPDNLPRGTKIEYRVQPGDSLTSIAIKFNSTEDAILEENEDLDDPNSIFAGQLLIIPTNLVTPAPTATTATGASTPGAIVTLTPQPSPTP